ncbi:MAG: UvrB/UvrC motif-containing protein [Treponemataceae bacterium]|nr:UvrB/UvrC motif-containing protein [Treponemataceae bacterium]
MKCDLCEKEAAVFVEGGDGGSRKRVSLCAECAAAHGLPLRFAERKTMSLLLAEITAKKGASPDGERRLCPACGKCLSEIVDGGIAGCPECYVAFHEEIAEAMRRHGLYGTYAGSLPRRLASFRSALTDRLDLQTKLEEAVRSENYEKAAVYRDYLRVLERGGVADGSAADAGEPETDGSGGGMQ